MANNPLQKYFRQPKIFISLPSKGIYNNPGVITGDVGNMPIFGMTGMDEIIIKTPDALLTGESTVKVIESCCPTISSGWEVTNLDLDLILTAIRIATYGNSITISHRCEHCSADNDYELELTNLIDHYQHVVYDNKVALKEVVVKLRPLSYKQVTDFSIENFQLQQKLIQAQSISDDDERNKLISKLYVDFGMLQVEIYSASIESIEAGNQVVEERLFIDEWLKNTEKETFAKLKEHIDKNKEAWKTPPQLVECDNCKKENTLSIELDHSNFFAGA
jgi:hypothetical protein